jgi:cell division protein FtsI/penicillin-binding protein 2
VVYGKTGTAQTFKNVSDNSAFVCFAARPGGEPEIAIALYGEKVAHPTNLMTVAEEIVRAYFSRYQTSDAVTNENRIG